jgi:hypothetical protein
MAGPETCKTGESAFHVQQRSGVYTAVTAHCDGKPDLLFNVPLLRLACAQSEREEAETERRRNIHRGA